MLCIDMQQAQELIGKQGTYKIGKYLMSGVIVEASNHRNGKILVVVQDESGPHKKGRSSGYYPDEWFQPL